MDVFGCGAIQDKQSAAAINKGAHSAAATGAQRSRRYRNLAREALAAIDGPRQINPPMGFTGLCSSRVPYDVDVTLRTRGNGKSAVEALGILHQIALRREGCTGRVEAGEQEWR